MKFICGLACLLAASTLVFAADGGGKLTIYLNGTAIANETYTIQQSAGKIDLSGSGSAHLGQIEATIDQYRVVTDDKYDPLEAEVKAKVGQNEVQVKTTFADGKATNTVTRAQGVTTKDDTVSPDTIVVSQNIPLFPLSVIARRASFAVPDVQNFHAYILGHGEVPLTVTYKGKETVEFANKKSELNHLEATLTPAPGKPIDLEFWVPDDRQIVKLTVPSQHLEAYQEGYEPKPQPKPAPEAAPKPAPEATPAEQAKPEPNPAPAKPGDTK
ncbi:MAG: hypothetical protein ACRD4P_06775 [Bryobacteraceae bacterium]